MNAIKVVKVSPYPIAAEVIKGDVSSPSAPPSPGPATAPSAPKFLIMKLTQVGFMLKSPKGAPFKVGENCKIKFEVPHSKKIFTESVKVIKIYHAFGEAPVVGLSADPTKATAVKGHEVFHTIEFHFRNLSDEAEIEIQKFIKKINQK